MMCFLIWTGVLYCLHGLLFFTFLRFCGAFIVQHAGHRVRRPTDLEISYAPMLVHLLYNYFYMYFIPCVDGE